ncbi:MAG: hypothetical protein E6K70_22580, partial [Planctomycetota bacterium]
MIKWVRLLKIEYRDRPASPEQIAFDEFTSLLEILHSLTLSDQQKAEAIEKKADDLTKLLREGMSVPPENLRFFRSVAVGPTAIVWAGKDVPDSGKTAEEAIQETLAHGYQRLVAFRDQTTVEEERNFAAAELGFLDSYKVSLGHYVRGFRQTAGQEIFLQLPENLRRRAVGY